MPYSMKLMKNIFFLGLAALTSAAATAQNTAVITQQGSSHEVSVAQQGTGNTSVVNQSRGSSNSVVISQSGGSNVATINQGGTPDGTAGSQNTVTTSQSGEGETIVNQTKDGNSISVYQSGPVPADKKKKSGKKPLKD